MESNQRDQSLWDLGATNSLVAFSTERGSWTTHSLLRFRRTFFDYQSPFSTLEFGWESNPLFIQKKPFQTFTFQTNYLPKLLKGEPTRLPVSPSLYISIERRIWTSKVYCRSRRNSFDHHYHSLVYLIWFGPTPTPSKGVVLPITLKTYWVLISDVFTVSPPRLVVELTLNCV